MPLLPSLSSPHIAVTIVTPLPLPPPSSLQVCFLGFSEIVCELSIAFYPSYKELQAGEGGPGGRLGRSPSSEQVGGDGESNGVDSCVTVMAQQEIEGSSSIDQHDGGCL